MYSDYVTWVGNEGQEGTEEDEIAKDRFFISNDTFAKWRKLKDCMENDGDAVVPFAFCC